MFGRPPKAYARVLRNLTVTAEHGQSQTDISSPWGVVREGLHLPDMYILTWLPIALLHGLAEINQGMNEAISWGSGGHL